MDERPVDPQALEAMGVSPDVLRSPEQRAREAIPVIRIEEHAPALDEHALHTLDDQWETFWKLRSKDHVGNRGSRVQEVSMLRDGDLMHHLAFDENALASLFRTGVMSGELGDDAKELEAEDQETHYCADFFVNEGDKTVAQYVDYAQEQEPNSGSLRRKRIESYRAPRATNDSIALTLNAQQPELEALLEHSSIGTDASALEGFSVRFPHGERPNITRRHRAVLVGLPANFITSMIVGGKIMEDPEKLQKLKDLLVEAELDIPILGVGGERL